jgi:hypothetical protein
MTHVLGGFEEPVLGGGSIGDGLLGGERLGSDNEDGGLPITRLQNLCQVGSINVGNKVHLQVSLRVVLECFADHDGSQVGSSNTNVDNGIDLFASVPRIPSCERGHREPRQHQLR